jgi:hypothetical protein
VWKLLDLNQNKLQKNCPGSATELRLEAHPSNFGSIYVGSFSAIGGALTPENCAYRLTPVTGPRIYRSTYPGSSVPIGDLQVRCSSGCDLRVEVQA